MDKETKKNDSSWVDSAGYFFATEQRGGTGSILNDFGWNRDSSTTCFLEFGEQIDSEQQQQQQQHGSDFAESFLLPENCSSSSTCSSQALLLPEEKSGDGSTSNALVSSSSSGDEQPEKSAGSDGKPPDKPSKGRKKGQKRTRQQRFAFMTKSDVDHLEDGYRWRKYGQKAVKNSPYPRSYYRCTNSKCTVKKRVERSCEDPTIVITTYEGQHCHHTVSFPRGGVFSHDGPFVSGLNPSASQMYAPSMQYRIRGHLGLTQPHQVQHEVRPSQRQPEPNSHQISDEGLLGDMVPPRMRNT